MVTQTAMSSQLGGSAGRRSGGAPFGDGGGGGDGDKNDADKSRKGGGPLRLCQVDGRTGQDCEEGPRTATRNLEIGMANNGHFED